jgi:hypothetical protein
VIVHDGGELTVEDEVGYVGPDRRVPAVGAAFEKLGGLPVKGN